MSILRPSERSEHEIDLDFRKTKTAGVTEVYLTPSKEQLRRNGFNPDEFIVEPQHLLTFDKSNKRVIVHPFYTAPNDDGEFTVKYRWLEGIAFDWREPKLELTDVDVESAMDWLPEEFSKNPDYGLGIKSGFKSVLKAAADHTDKSVFYFGDHAPLENEFKIDLKTFRKMCAEIRRIDSRAKTAENEVKVTTAYNFMAMMTGVDSRPFRIGRQKIRQLIQAYAADPNFSDPKIQEELVTEVAKAAGTFAKKNPSATDELVSDLQLTRLETAISKFEDMLPKHLSENDWQKFFESEPFLLSFAFGYPVSIVNGQSYVGGRKIDGKGEKIGDFLYKHSLSNNAALIEIKKPQTPILKKYRDDVYAPHEELSGGITQVLDQRYRLTQNFSQQRADNEWFGEDEVADFEVDCVLIIGKMPTEKSKRKSFQLFRKNSHGVHIVTFDELLENIKQLLVYLRADEET